MKTLLTPRTDRARASDDVSNNSHEHVHNFFSTCGEISLATQIATRKKESGVRGNTLAKNAKVKCVHLSPLKIKEAK